MLDVDAYEAFSRVKFLAQLVSEVVQVPGTVRPTLRVSERAKESE